MKRKILIITAALLAVILLGSYGYVSDYFRADSSARDALVSSDTVTVTQDDGRIIFAPAEPTAGFIFYPGGKVEHTAYGPLMMALAERNTLCILVEMPFRLAVLDVDGANHAGFAMYGPQEGDGSARITTTEQIGITAELLKQFFQGE